LVAESELLREILGENDIFVTEIDLVRDTDGVADSERRSSLAVSVADDALTRDALRLSEERETVSESVTFEVTVFRLTEKDAEADLGPLVAETVAVLHVPVTEKDSVN
jgi:hypothetical protein